MSEEQANIIRTLAQKVIGEIETPFSTDKLIVRILRHPQVRSFLRDAYPDRGPRWPGMPVVEMTKLCVLTELHGVLHSEEDGLFRFLGVPQYGTVLKSYYRFMEVGPVVIRKAAKGRQLSLIGSQRVVKFLDELADTMEELGVKVVERMPRAKLIELRDRHGVSASDVV